MARADFEALIPKRDDTLYFVNESGDFDPESLDTEGDIYLGDKPLTAVFNPSDPIANRQGVFFVKTDHTSTSDAWSASLPGLTNYYEGLRLAVFNTVASGTASTLAVNHLDPVRIRRNGGAPIQNGIDANSVTTLTLAVVDGEYAFIIDTYDYATYNLANNYNYIGCIMTDSYAIPASRLAMFTTGGLLTPLVTNPSSSGTGKTLVNSCFPIYGPGLFSASSAFTANTINTGKYLLNSRSYLDIRYNSVSHHAKLIPSNQYSEVWMPVTVNHATKTFNLTTETYNIDGNDYTNNFTNQRNLKPGSFYMFVGWKYSNNNNYYVALSARNPICYYDQILGPIPYDTWLHDQLKAKVNALRSFTERTAIPDADITLQEDVTEDWFIRLNETENGASTVDFTLNATLHNTDPKPINVEFAIKLCYYHEDEWVDAGTLSAGEVSIPDAASRAHVSLAAQLGPTAGYDHAIKVLFRAIGGSASVLRQTDSNWGWATKLHIRSWSPLTLV